MQREREYLLHLRKIKVAELLNFPEGNRMPMVSVFNTLKKQTLIIASDQERVVLAVKVEKLGHCSELSDLVLPLLCQTSRSFTF